MGKLKNLENGGRRRRAPNFTDMEIRILMKLAFAHMDIIECKKTDSETWKIKDTLWNNITQNFNIHTGVTKRTVETVRQKYEGIKKLARKKVAKNKEEEGRLDGPADFIELEDYETELIQILESTANDLSPIYESEEMILPETNFNAIKTESSQNTNESTKNPEDRLESGFEITDDDMLWDLPDSYSRPRLKLIKKHLENMKKDEERRLKEHKFRIRNLQVERRILINKERRAKAEHQKKMELLDMEISLKRQLLENNNIIPRS